MARTPVLCVLLLAAAAAAVRAGNPMMPTTVLSMEDPFPIQMTCDYVG